MAVTFSFSFFFSLFLLFTPRGCPFSDAEPPSGNHMREKKESIAYLQNMSSFSSSHKDGIFFFLLLSRHIFSWGPTMACFVFAFFSHSAFFVFFSFLPVSFTFSLSLVLCKKLLHEKCNSTLLVNVDFPHPRKINSDFRGGERRVAVVGPSIQPTITERRTGPPSLFQSRRYYSRPPLSISSSSSFCPLLLLLIP